ncbi:hypothetical protein F5B22DRAFT_516497 [Xylaria bambusicola]|uniref:uncharacterized protein n=1 Tax=Xylaria bambusicola TaxID=326684 RepID=UPI0020087717|nr:uncharacterized protein F5B22DRAFT_516497 [Xylaria bambusicola]KAI0505638.1 hypothetical protein F5B22DRAFT_516497 [Xylaria bambusicola]
MSLILLMQAFAWAAKRKADWYRACDCGFPKFAMQATNNPHVVCQCRTPKDHGKPEGTSLMTPVETGRMAHYIGVLDSPQLLSDSSAYLGYSARRLIEPALKMHNPSAIEIQLKISWCRGGRTSSPTK